MASALPAVSKTFKGWAGNNQKYTGGSFDAMATLTGSKHPGDMAGVMGHLGAKDAVETAPTITPPVAMPDQQAIEADKKRSLADQLARRGRASTILTDQNDKLGG